MEENKVKKIFLSNQTMKSAKVPGQEESEPPQWSQLPATIIIEIYKNLGDVDRVAMARVCQSWNQCFRVHVLWRSRAATFGGRRTKQDMEIMALYKSKTALKWSYGECAIEFAKQFPSSIQFLDIHFNLCEIYEKEIVNFFNEFSDCLDGAKIRNIRISCLGLEAVRRQMEKDLIDTLKRLLHNQHSLRKFRMHWSFFDLETGPELLECLAEASAPTIEDLDLYGLFQNRMSLDLDGRVSTELQKFTGLSCVHLIYDLMSEELAKTWVTRCPNLSFIKLYVDEYLQRSHVKSLEAWKSLVRSHPHLLVELHAYRIHDSEHMLDILSPAIPLFNLYWNEYGGDTTSLELTRIIDRVASYHRTIKHLHLCFSGHFPNLNTTAVESILSECTNLLPFKCSNTNDDFTHDYVWTLSQETWWLEENDS